MCNFGCLQASSRDVMSKIRSNQVSNVTNLCNGPSKALMTWKSRAIFKIWNARFSSVKTILLLISTLRGPKSSGDEARLILSGHTNFLKTRALIRAWSSENSKSSVRDRKSEIEVRGRNRASEDVGRTMKVADSLVAGLKPRFGSLVAGMFAQVKFPY